MIDYQSEVTINKPVQEVFALFKDVGRYDEWTDMSGTRLVSGDGLRPGSRIETTMKLGPANQAMTFEVAAYEENRRISWKTVSNGALTWEADFIFTPQGDSATRLKSSGQIQLNGLLKLSESLMAGEIRNGEAKELMKFKELAEKG